MSVSYMHTRLLLSYGSAFVMLLLLLATQTYTHTVASLVVVAAYWMLYVCKLYVYTPITIIRLIIRDVADTISYANIHTQSS